MTNVVISFFLLQGSQPYTENGIHKLHCGLKVEFHSRSSYEAGSLSFFKNLYNI